LSLPLLGISLGLNGVIFGDSGELYIQIGSNTNGGLPGPLSGSQLLKENYYSAATVVAELSDPLFDGYIAYDKEDDGRPISGRGIGVFASGIRNSYSVVLHSNGNLYATDNGPNLGYGKNSIISVVFLYLAMLYGE
jgi:glucose/arabinose dehydrogenase